MTTSPDLIPLLQDRLVGVASAATKDWWERYLKGAIEFRGVPMAGIRAAVHEWFTAQRLDRLAADAQRSVAYDLIGEPIAEDKLAGILLLQEILAPAGLVRCDADLADLGRLFDEGAIADWNTCDWLCVRVLGPLAADVGEECARVIAGWSDAANLWRARAAGVAFVNMAPDGDANFAGFTEMLLDVCAHNVRRSERFAQTGVGWVLRELSVAAPGDVAGFVRTHAADMSRQAVRSAVRKLPEATAAELLSFHAERGRRA